MKNTYSTKAGPNGIGAIAANAGTFDIKAINIRTFLLAAALAAALTAVLPNLALADAVGRIKVLRGDATILSNGAAKPASAGMEIHDGDILQTGSNGRMGVTFKDSTRFALGPDSEVQVDEFSFNSTTHEGRFDSKINKGSLSVISGKIAKAKPDAMTLRTPTTILGVRGTNFLVKVD